MKSDMIHPDLSFLEYAYPHLKSNLSWWESNRFDGTLFSYKVHKMESGWDNTVRFDFPHLIQNCYAVDCNCFMADFTGQWHTLQTSSKSRKKLNYILKKGKADLQNKQYSFFKKRQKLLRL